METLKLETNKPVELAFKWTTGKDCESQFTGPQKLFTVTLADGETKPLYLSVGAGERIEKLLAEQKIGPGEFLDLCKAEVRAGNRKSIEYQVKRRDPAPTNGNGANGVHPPAPQAPVTQSQESSHATATNGNTSNGHAPTSNGHSAINPPRTKLADALITAVAAVVATREYAASIGFTLPGDLSWEDLRAMAATILINGSREAANTHASGGSR